MLCVLGGEGSIRPDRYYLRYSVVYFFRGCSAKMSRGSDGLESIWDATSVSLVASHAFTLTERRLNAVLQMHKDRDPRLASRLRRRTQP
jgi:hypothetical protein